MDTLNHEELIAYLNAETAKISWQELQPYFAKGLVVRLQAGFDLVDIAAALIRDDKSIILPLVESKDLEKLTDIEANQYQVTNNFWAVVIAPWVVIQQQTE